MRAEASNNDSRRASRRRETPSGTRGACIYRVFSIASRRGIIYNIDTACNKEKPMNPNDTLSVPNVKIPAKKQRINKNKFLPNLYSKSFSTPRVKNYPKQSTNKTTKL